jgi:hypothetical protein
VLIDYYLYRESIELSLYLGRSTEDVFEGGLEGMGEGRSLSGCLRSSKAWLAAAAANLDPYRLKVAEEMLL